ncbi:MAG TPA: hypothetical protein VD866_20185 [Urbifossiella sp.]|nr:hypothetical protein [Urbifossiella sp.]
MVRTKRRPATAAGPEAASELVLDLDTFRLAGVGCGDPVSRLRFLGPGCACAAGVWEYPAHGLTLAVGRRRVLAFRVHVRPRSADAAAGVQPFAGVIRFRGSAFDPRPIACEDDVIDQFGIPVVVRGLADGCTLEYAAGRVVWEAVLSADGRLASVGVTHSR